MTQRPGLLKPAPKVPFAGFVGGLAVACGVALTATSGWLIVQASTRPVILTLLTAVVGVRAFGIGRPVFRYVERIVSHDGALADLRDRRTATYRELIPLTPARLGRRRRADLLTGVVRDLDDEVDVQVRSLVPFLANILTSVIAIALMFVLLPQAGWVILAYCLLAVVIAALDWSLERRGHQRALDARARVQQAAHLAAANTLELQAIGATSAARAWLAKAQDDVESAARAGARGRATGMGLSLLLTGVSTAVMALTVAGPLHDGVLSAPVAALIVFTPLALGDVLGMLPDAVGALARGQAAHARLGRLLSQTPAVVARSTDPLITSIPQITLRDVTASWTDDRIEHLAPTTLTIAPREHVAITGPNGAGKSTLLAVLARHLDPTGGSYEIDGRDVRTVSLDDIRALFAIVDDEPHIFAGTVRANLLLAAPEASDRELVSALVQAGLGQWFTGLASGLETVLGDGGRGVSGGERARFAIARAVLSGRPVVLLDEPVAHLDVPTARAVLRDLHEATANRTVIIVSHQQVGQEQCDRVVALNNASKARPVTQRSQAW